MYDTGMWYLGGGRKETDRTQNRFCKIILQVPRFAANNVTEL
jgi:hypothetical protein